MFGSAVLEVALGLVLVFLVASLVCTSVKEAFESWLRKRGEFLKRGLGELLSGPGGTATGAPDWVRKFYTHPLISCLYMGNFEAKSRNLPSYIPPGAFSSTLIHLVGREAARYQAELAETSRTGANAESIKKAGELAAAAHQFDLTSPRAALLKSVEGLPAGHLQESLQAVLSQTGPELADVKTSLETWFNDSMDRVGGYYKRHSQRMIILIALVVTLSLNLNALTIAQKLVTDSALRKALVAQAEAYAQQSAPATAGSDSSPATETTDPVAQIQKAAETVYQLNLPIGWDQGQPPTTGWGWVSLIAGYLGTLFAISLGAPFWFELLNRIIQARAALNPPAGQKRSTEVPAATTAKK